MLPVQEGKNKPSLVRDGWVVWFWGSGCSAVMAWVMEMATFDIFFSPAATSCAPNEPLSCCHTSVPSIPVVCLPATALYADLSWSSQASRRGMWEKMGSQCQCVPKDSDKNSGEQLLFLAGTPRTWWRGQVAHYL